MPGTYASTTEVPVSKSRDEVERTLSRFGATGFAYAVESGPPERVMVSFEIKSLRVLMRMTLPGRDEFRLNAYGNERPASAVEKDWERACRQRWRTLANAVKAKLAMVDDGLSTVEREFLADVVTAEGATVGDLVVPELREVVRTAALPPLVPGPPGVIALAAGKRRP